MISRRLFDWLCVMVIEVWRLTPLLTIFQLYRGAVLLVEKTQVGKRQNQSRVPAVVVIVW
jgi:ABC-type amino acid transport system permease subunit